jgi:hypothetical protein
MAAGFSDQHLSAHTGAADFAGWLHLSGFVSVLPEALPQGLGSFASTAATF